MTTLMHELGITVEDALGYLVQKHNTAVDQYDRLADEVVRTAAQLADRIARWLQEIRFATVGFIVWQAQAPRYKTHNVVSWGMVIEPRFRFV